MLGVDGDRGPDQVQVVALRHLQRQDADRGLLAVGVVEVALVGLEIPAVRQVAGHEAGHGRRRIGIVDRPGGVVEVRECGHGRAVVAPRCVRRASDQGAADRPRPTTDFPSGYAGFNPAQPPSPASRARRMAAARSATWSLVKIEDRWLATVFGDSPSRVAIAALGSAAASRSRISRSRAVSSGKGSATGGGRGEVAQHPLGHAGGEDRLAGGHGADRPADLLLLGALDHVAAGAGAHGREHRVLVVEHRQDQHARPRAPPGRSPGSRANPSSSGICRSSIATSGRCSTTSLTALRPSAATPTTSTSGSEPEQRGEPGPDHRDGRRPAPPRIRAHRDEPAGTRPGPARRRATDRPRRRRPARRSAPAWPASPTPGDHGPERRAVVADRHLEAVAVAQPDHGRSGPRRAGRRWSGPRSRSGTRRPRPPRAGWAPRPARRGEPGRRRPSARQRSCSARCRRAPTRPSSSRAGGRRSSTTRRTSASAARVSRRKRGEQFAGPVGVGDQVGGRIGGEGDAGQRRDRDRRAARGGAGGVPPPGPRPVARARPAAPRRRPWRAPRPPTARRAARAPADPGSLRRRSPARSPTVELTHDLAAVA